MQQENQGDHGEHLRRRRLFRTVCNAGDKVRGSRISLLLYGRCTYVHLKRSAMSGLSLVKNFSLEHLLEKTEVGQFCPDKRSCVNSFEVALDVTNYEDDNELLVEHVQLNPSLIELELGSKLRSMRPCAPPRSPTTRRGSATNRATPSSLGTN